MLIKTKLTEKDFINANFVLLYSKTFNKIYTWFIACMLLISIAGSFFYPAAVSFSSYIVPLVLLTIIPLVTYFSAKRNFAANKTIQEHIEYQFGNDKLLITGESFHAQLSWNKVYKVTQTKNWILIWQNRQIANPVPKRDIWEGDIASLKELLDKHQVKNDL